MSNKPQWLLQAEKYIGTKEIKGPKNNNVIVNFWAIIKQAGIRNDEIPWCAAYVSAVLEECGFKSTRSGWAKSYLNWGIKLTKPAIGCIVVFTRKGGGHVGFVEGQDSLGNLYVLGGNQSDAVNIKKFSTKDVVGYRWPDVNVPRQPLEVLSADDIDFETKVT